VCGVILRCERQRASKDDKAVHVAILRDAAQARPLRMTSMNW
jgi:hypothetical protein